MFFSTEMMTDGGTGNGPNGAIKKHSSKPRKSAITVCLETLRNGGFLMKVRGKSKVYKRFYVLDEDYLSFGYRDSAKAKAGKEERGKVLINEINEIRDGPLTDVFVKAYKHLKVPEDQCFSVVFGDRHDTLDLVAPDKQVKDSWVNGLRHLVKKRKESDVVTQQEMWMRELFRHADRNGDQTLTIKEVLGLLKHLNIDVDLATAKEVFDKADTNKETTKKGDDCLDLNEFIVFYQMLTKRDEIGALFEKYNYEGRTLDVQELKDFFAKEQHQNLSNEQCINVIQRFESCPNLKLSNVMGLDGFNAMFLSPGMNVFNPACGNVYQDMNQPLSHYFIDSSHNTYLAEDQIFGPSSVEAYIRALKTGCRCVELDCWDGDKGDPVIYHGHTMTSKILFRDVIYAINAYAFEASEYPIILSIENHCSVMQQRLMADYMNSIFGDRLFKTPLPVDLEALPSLGSLKGKILVKGKKLSEKRPVSDNDDDNYVSDEDESAEIPEEKVQEAIATLRKKEAKHKLASELSNCVIVCQSVSFKNFDTSKQKYNCKQMSSFGESKANDLSSNQSEKWVDHNKWQMSRIYPAGRRTDSSNYDPVPMWTCGNQIVALNYQTPDDAMQFNEGRFEDNGQCGYVLKPAYMRLDGFTFNPKGPYPMEWKRKLKVTVVSGYQLPKKKGDKAKSILDPYVQIDVRGVPIDYRSQQTTHIHNNGFHPVWNQSFDFDITVPELALVQFRVMDHEGFGSNVLVAQYCLPFNCLQNGYRTVHLKSKYGEPIWGASLLVHIIKT